MGENTLHGYFYKPALGAEGEVEMGKFHDALDVADAEIKANKSARHTQGTDYSNIVICADYDNPNDAITAIDSANKTLLVTESEICDVNFTVPANVTVRFERGGKWTINDGITVTFDGWIDAGLWQIFEYVGAGTLTNLTQEVFTTWWNGNVGVQINAAVSALANNGVITIPEGIYSFDTEITLGSSIILQGAGIGTTQLLWTGTNNTEHIITTNGNVLKLQDFQVLVEDGKCAKSIINIKNTRHSHFVNLSLVGSSDNTTTLNGIYAEGDANNSVYYNLFENITIAKCNENFHLLGTGVTQNTFINCQITSAGLYGFYGRGNKFVILGTSFEANPIALKTEHGGMEVIGCYFEANTDTDIYIDAPTGFIVQGCWFRVSATKDYSIYCTGIAGTFKQIQIESNFWYVYAGTVTTAIHLCSGANAENNVFDVIGEAVLTNEYYAPTGSKVNGYGGTGNMNDIVNVITFTGNHKLGLTLTDDTSITLPTSGTLIAESDVKVTKSGSKVMTGENVDVAEISFPSAGWQSVLIEVTTTIAGNSNLGSIRKIYHYKGYTSVTPTLVADATLFDLNSGGGITITMTLDTGKVTVGFTGTDGFYMAFEIKATSINASGQKKMSAITLL